MSRSSRLPLKVFVATSLVSEQFSCLHVDPLTSGGNTSSGWNGTLWTLCMMSGGLCADSSVWVFCRMVTFPGNYIIRLVNIFGINFVINHHPTGSCADLILVACLWKVKQGEHHMNPNKGKPVRIFLGSWTIFLYGRVFEEKMKQLNDGRHLNSSLKPLFHRATSEGMQKWKLLVWPLGM